MTFKVVNTADIPGLGSGEDLLKPFDAELVTGMWLTEEDLIENSHGANAIICSGPSQPWTSRVIQSLSHCRIIASRSIGYDRIDLTTATAMGIVVTNLPEYCIDEVANQSIALIMALGRKLFLVDRAIREKQPGFSPIHRGALEEYLTPIFRLRDQTVGIVGFGKIGTAVALKARGLGMHVVAYDPYVLDGVMASHGVQPVTFETLLKVSDFVSINAALTNETHNMFDQKAFSAMKPTSYLINTARGQIVDQDALVRALGEKSIAGAGLDVTAVEPIPADDPILRQQNVIFTGHSGWYSTAADSAEEYWHKAMAQVVIAFKGEWPPYAVNPEVKQKWIERWKE